MKKKLALALSLAAALSVGSAYAQKKSLVIGMGSADAGKLDPHLASTTPDKGLLNYIFNGLTIADAWLRPDGSRASAYPRYWRDGKTATGWTRV